MDNGGVNLVYNVLLYCCCAIDDVCDGCGDVY